MKFHDVYSLHKSRGQYLWPAARSLSVHLIEHWEFLKATNILELGAGVQIIKLTSNNEYLTLRPLDQCGLAGLAVNHLPGVKTVTFTDHDPGCMQLIQENIALNMDQMRLVDNKVYYLSWGESELLNADFNRSFREAHSLGSFDLIIGSDLIYCKEVIRSLLETVKNLLNPIHGTFVLATSFSLGNVR